MADSNHIVNFIRFYEGKLSKNPNDTASANPVPDGSGFHTSSGITWKVWSSVYGVGTDSIARFYAMNNADWLSIFKPLYWDAALGDLINSQRIADLLTDAIWASGKHNIEVRAQHLLNTEFHEHLSEDGNFGPASIKAINSADEETLYNDIIANRMTFLDQIVAANPNDAGFLKGWQNRINSLVRFEATGVISW